MENGNIISDKLDMLKREIDFIKEHLVDITLTHDDINSIHEAEEDLRKGKTTSLKDLKKLLSQKNLKADSSKSIEFEIKKAFLI